MVTLEQRSNHRPTMRPLPERTVPLGHRGLSGGLTASSSSSSPTTRHARHAEPLQVAQTPTQQKPEVTKTYFRLLQAIHHSEIISTSLETNTFPKGMTNKVNKMSTFIKPACPNQNTLMKVELNTTEWVRNNFVILRDHYDEVISTNLLEIPAFQLEAYNRALKWASLRYGRKLTKSSIDTLRSMIMTNQHDRSDQTPPLILDKTDFPELPPPALPMQRVFGPKSENHPHVTSLTAVADSPPLPNPIVITASLTPQPREQRKSRLSRRRTENILSPHLTMTTGIIQLPHSDNTMEAPEIIQSQTRPDLNLNRTQTTLQMTVEEEITLSHPLSSPSSQRAQTTVTLDSNILLTTPICTTTIADKSGENVLSAQFLDLPTTAAQVPLTKTDGVVNPLEPLNVTTQEPIEPNDLVLSPHEVAKNGADNSSLITTCDKINYPRDHLLQSRSLQDDVREELHTEGQSDNTVINVTLPCLNNVATVISDSISSAPLSQSSPVEPNKVSLRSRPNEARSDVKMNTIHSKAPIHPMRKVADRTETAASVDLPADSEDDIQTPVFATHPQSFRREPKRHPNTNRKIKEWSLEVIKPVVIVGDSNLARIPAFESEEVQVDSFPGATCHHIYELLKKMKPVYEVREVILSVGLNNGLKRLLPTTTDKQMGLLMTVARQTFPNAKIRVPVINYSEKLDIAQQQLLESLNKTIVKKYDFLTEINPLHFQVSHDFVHWTSSTATLIIEHWLDQLNL